MGFDLVNQYPVKILAAIEDGDSINRISQKTGISYSYTHEWIERLEDIDAVERNNGIHITDEELADEYEALLQTVVRRELPLDNAYLLPNFAHMDYRYTKTDAVYIWTKGGYQIARNQNDYPIFIDVLEEEIEAWQAFFEEFSIESSIEKRLQEGVPGIYFVLFPRDIFDSEWVESSPVMPLDDTVKWAKRFEVNFQPALEMLDEMYDLDMEIE